MSSVDVPRLLTRDEIETIISRVAKPQIMVSEIRNHVYNQIKTMFRYQLGVVKVKPSKLEKLGDYIENKSERSFYQAGNPVGFNVAESIGQPSTQLILRTFHKAGQIGGSILDRIKKNIFPTQYKKAEGKFEMKVHMYDKDLSYEHLYIKSQQFVTVRLSDLLEETRMIKENYPFDDMSMYTPEFLESNSHKDLGCAIRLRFNTEKLLLHRIDIDTIAIELEKIGDGNTFTVFVGPQLLGVIDIYPNPDKICSKETENLEECCDIFENGILKTKLESTFLGDYKDVYAAIVKNIKVIDSISDITDHYIEDQVSDTLKRVWINGVYVKKEGVPISKVEDLLNLSGFKVVDSDEHGNYFIVESTTNKIKEALEDALKIAEQKSIDSFTETKRLTSSDLYIAGFYNIIETGGSNLAKVRIHPEVDEYHTISNSPNEIFDVFGVEVARSYLEKEIYDIFAADSQLISPRNIRIMVDWMTAGIKLISVNPKSVMKQDSSVIRSLCFENVRHNIVKGSVLGTEEPLSNVSARVMFGSRQTLGTGAFSIHEDPEIVELYESFKSEESTGAYRLTSDTLSMKDSIIGSKTRRSAVTRPIIPKEDSDLFGSDLSRGSELEF